MGIREKKDRRRASKERATEVKSLLMIILEGPTLANSLASPPLAAIIIFINDVGDWINEQQIRTYDS